MLATGLSKRKISEFVQNDEVHAALMLGEPPCRPLRVSVSRRLTRSTTL